MMSRFSGFWVLIAPFMMVGPGALGSFPEVDAVVWGRIKGSDLSKVKAKWPAGEAPASNVGNGNYVIQIPIDDTVQNAGGGRSFAAHAGDTVQVLYGADLLDTFVLTQGVRGLVVRVDLPGAGPGSFHRGDADQNGALQLTDGIAILNYLFLGVDGNVTKCLDAADVDDNGLIQLTDAVRILGYLFIGNAGPPELPGPPSEPCGLDPTPDDQFMDCNYAECSGDGGNEGRGGGGGATDGAGGDGGLAALAGNASLAERLFSSNGPVKRPGQSQDLLLAGSLEIDPPHLAFGAVSVNRASVKTVILRNNSSSEIKLLYIHGSSPAYSPLDAVLVLQPGGQVRLGVRFTPREAGQQPGTLTIAPGIALPLEGEGTAEQLLGRVSDLLVAPLDWEAGLSFAVPVFLSGVSPGMTVDLALHDPTQRCVIQGLWREDDLLSLDPWSLAERSGESSPWLFAGKLESQSGETTIQAFMVVKAVPGASDNEGRGLICPLVWDRISIAGSGGSQVGMGANGEVVVCAEELDVDADLATRLSSDLVFAHRRLAKLDPVPPRFNALIEIDRIVLDRRLEALDLRGILEDLDPIGLRLLGAGSTNNGVERLDFLSRSSAHSLGSESSILPTGNHRVWLEPSPGDEPASLQVEATEAHSSLAVTMDLSTPDVDLVVTPLPGYDVLSGRDPEDPKRWVVLLQDHLGENWISAGRTQVAWFHVMATPGRANPQEPVTARIQSATLARGPLASQSSAESTSCNLPLKQTVVAGEPVDLDCDGNGVPVAADVVFLARFIFAGGAAPPVLTACDVTKDGVLDVRDVLELARRIVQQ